MDLSRSATVAALVGSAESLSRLFRSICDVRVPEDTQIGLDRGRVLVERGELLSMRSSRAVMSRRRALIWANGEGDEDGNHRERAKIVRREPKRAHRSWLLRSLGR